jgi:hypothetical protein
MNTFSRDVIHITPMPDGTSQISITGVARTRPLKREQNDEKQAYSGFSDYLCDSRGWCSTYCKRRESLRNPGCGNGKYGRMPGTILAFIFVTMPADD